MSEPSSPTVEYAESFLSHFSKFASEDDLFEPELATATRVVALMRSAEVSDDNRFARIASEMRSLERIPHYDGSGWHGFKNAVQWWLEERGYQP